MAAQEDTSSRNVAIGRDSTTPPLHADEMPATPGIAARAGRNPTHKDTASEAYLRGSARPARLLSGEQQLVANQALLHCVAQTHR